MTKRSYVHRRLSERVLEGVSCNWGSAQKNNDAAPSETFPPFRARALSRTCVASRYIHGMMMRLWNVLEIFHVDFFDYRHRAAGMRNIKASGCRSRGASSWRELLKRVGSITGRFEKVLILCLRRCISYSSPMKSLITELMLQNTRIFGLFVS